MGGKAKIFPLVNFMSVSEGIQFLSPVGSLRTFSSYVNLPKGSGDFEIDLVNNRKESIRMLEYISYLMLAQMGKTGYTYSFVVKGPDGYWGDQYFDFGFDRNGVFKVEDLFSPILPNSFHEDMVRQMGVEPSRVIFYDYYTSTVYPEVFGHVIEMSTVDYIDFLAGEFEDIWDVIIPLTHHEIARIRSGYRDLLRNPTL